MSTLIILILILFPVGILLKKIFPNLCALCFAISGAWIVGLVALSVGGLGTPDALSVGILMGGSAVGSMYYLSSRLPRKYQLFKLPYIVTALACIYVVLTQQSIAVLATVTGVMWAVFIFLYVLRNNTRFKKGINSIIACCKNW